MGSSEKTLQSLLVEVGNKLQKPPTSVRGLLPLLDRVEVYLSRVEQSPSKEIQTVLSPIKKALVGDELLRHPDVDVKVWVASCISEITRITAPQVPYDDEPMKEAFQLIVSSFESLADQSSQSYVKRISILETVAKVRSCVVMLDLECDDLILEMFRHFINAIRDDHPENVFTSMENIMNRVIGESEEISSDLLSCILVNVKKDNKDVKPIARKLMNKVIQSSADKLIPYIKIAVKTNGLSLADYDEVVNHLCLETSAETVGLLEHTDASVRELMVSASQLVELSTDAFQTTGEVQVVAVSSIEKLPADCCSGLALSNGNADAEVDTFSISSTMKDSKSSKNDDISEAVSGTPSAVCKPVGQGIKADTKVFETITPPAIDDNLDVENVDEEQSKTEAKANKIMKTRGRKPKAKKKTPKPRLAGKLSSVAKQASELAGPHKSSNEVIFSSPCLESSNEAAEKSSPTPLIADDVPSKEVSVETVKVDEKIVECCESKPVVSSLEKHTPLDVKTAISAAINLEERTTIHMVNASEVIATASKGDMSVEKIGAPNDENITKQGTANQVATPLLNEPVKVEPGDGKSPEQLGVPSEDGHDMEDDPSKIKDSIKWRGRPLGKATLHKRAAQAASENNNKKATTTQKSASKSVKHEEAFKETPKTSSKRKHDEENMDESKDYNEELVGSKVKVWWPADKEYYKGVIESYDSAKRKHKVLYVDGEVEHLVLKNQRWELISPDEDSDTESDEETPAAVSGKRHKGKEVNEGTSKKRLGRPPSSKSRKTSNKPGRKCNDHAKSNSESRDDSTAKAKALTESSKEKEKSSSTSESDLKSTENADSDSEETEEQTPSPAKAAGRSKRKAPPLDKENKSIAKSGLKRKNRRKH